MNKNQLRAIVRFALLSALLLGFSLTVSAQLCPTLTISHTPVRQLSVSDVDLDHFRSTTLLFTLVMGNTLDVDMSVQLSIRLDVTLADGSSFPGAIQYLSQPFVIPPGGKTVTNLDLGAGATEIKTLSYDYSPDAKDKLEEIALSTGQFPAGRYDFTVALNNCTGQVFELLLQNVSRVELRSPLDGESTNTFPLFEFYQDGPDAELVVAELLPGQSKEDAITRQPAMLDVDLQGQNSFFYSGGRQLEDGKTYVWQVTGKSLLTGGGSSGVKSEIRSFTVSNAAGASFDDQLLRQLEEILGSKYQDLFNQIRNGNFRITGKFSNNNQPITSVELMDLLNILRDAVDSAQVTFE